MNVNDDIKDYSLCISYIYVLQNPKLKHAPCCPSQKDIFGNNPTVLEHTL
jgi:hypothetical protein